jgi:hypothetical protein
MVIGASTDDQIDLLAARKYLTGLRICADDWRIVSTGRTICWCHIAQKRIVEMSGPLSSSIHWS